MSTATVQLHQGEPRTALEVEHLCDWSIDLDPVEVIATPTGLRMNYRLKAGRCKGERLSGEFVPYSGGDWVLVGNDSIGRIDVRCTLRTDDDELIYVTNSGVVAMPPEIVERFGAGERIPWNEMYARSLPRFETASEKYSWLNSIVCVAVNELAADHVDYRIYRIL